MIIEEHINGGHKFSYDTELKVLSVDDFDSEKTFDMDINGIKTLMNMFKFISDNRLL